MKWLDLEPGDFVVNETNGASWTLLSKKRHTDGSVTMRWFNNTAEIASDFGKCSNDEIPYTVVRRT